MSKEKEFKTAKEKYGIWPMTVWEANSNDQAYRYLKKLIGDFGEARKGCGGNGYCDKKKEHVSIFKPSVACWILNMFAPKSGVCFDPFAGGGTRAVAAAIHGLNYIGVDLRENELKAVRRRCLSFGIKKEVKLICSPSQDLSTKIKSESADFLFTCPPYWNLEKYKGGPQDISCLNDLDEFKSNLSRIIFESFRILKRGTKSVWVVGLHRRSNGELIPLNHVLADIHKQCGFNLKEEGIIYGTNNGAVKRVGNFEKGGRFLIRTHEYFQVFEKK